MRNFWTLLKINLINTFGLSKLKKKFAKSGKFIKIGAPALLIFLFLLLMGITFLYVFIFSTIFIATEEYEGMLILGVVVGSIICFMTSLTKAHSILFEAKDYDLLLAMPIKKGAIIGSKLSNLFILNYLSFGAVYIPSVVYYAIFAAPPVYFYPLAIIIFIIGPFLVVAVSTFLSYLIGIILSKFKYKSMIQSIVMVALVIVIMYGSMSLSQRTDLDPEDLKQYAISLQNTLGKIYYPGTWAVGGLTGNLLELLLFILVSIIPLVLLIMIVSSNFIKASERAKVSFRAKNFKLKQQKHRNQFGSLLRREFKRYFSNYAVVMNTIIGPIISTIFIVMFLFGQDSFGDLSALVEMELVVLILVGITIFIVGVSPTTTSSISLEGKTFWIIKSAPVKTSTVFLAKIAMSLFLSIPFFIINVIIAAFVLPLQVGHIILLIVIPILYTTFSSLLGLFLNLCFPKLDWDNPLKPVKQSMPVFLTLLIDWVLTVGLIIASIFLLAFGYVFVYMAIFGVIVIGIAVLGALTFTVGEKKYQRIPA